MRRPRPSRSRRGSLRHASRLGAVLALAAGASCANFDANRIALPKGTLGDDIYGALCDRLGASVLAEDESGRSYDAICHYDEERHYGTQVDESILPAPSSAKAVKGRARALAKMQAMGARRDQLIGAFNAMFPDIEVADEATADPDDKIRLHDALFRLGQTLPPLYEKDPFDPAAAPLFPTLTRSMGALFDSVAGDEQARVAFSQVWGRQGYRPFREALGALRPVLGDPELRPYLASVLDLLLPDGAPSPELRQLLAISQRELSTVGQSQEGEDPPPTTPLALLDAETATLSRPRTTLESIASVLLEEQDAYGGGPPRFIVRRDSRGFAVPYDSKPGISGTLSPPFVEDAAGFAAIDTFGRFVDATGKPLPVDAPFFLPGQPQLGEADIDGRIPDENGQPAYDYIATSRIGLRALLRDLKPLIDPDDPSKDSADPDVKAQHEALLKAFAGAHVLFGPREAARWSYEKGNERRLKDGEACGKGCVDYVRFRGEDSPFADLVHAFGQVLADEDSDAILMGVSQLMSEHEDEIARLLHAVSKIREYTRAHDDLAAQGKEPLAGLAYDVTIWDEMAVVLDEIDARPGMFEKLIDAFGDDLMVTPIGGAEGLGEAIGRFMRMRDKYSYDPSNPPGQGINITDSPPSYDDPHNLVNLTQPRTGDNRSILERSLQLMHDVNGAKVCNKEGAQIYLYSDGLGDHFLPGSYGQCGLFAVDNLAAFYFDALLPDGHPRRSVFPITNDILSGLLAFLESIGIPHGDLYSLFGTLSGIEGLGDANIEALNRFVVNGASADKPASGMWDFDQQNAGGRTDKFIYNMMNPVATISCGGPECETAEGTLRIRDHGTVMASERMGYFDYLRPIITTFADACNGVPPPDQAPAEACNAPGEYPNHGEQMFVDLLDVLYRHWADSGVHNYEPLAADAADQTELVPALVEFSKVASDLSKLKIVVKRGPSAGEERTGAQVIGKLIKILFSKQYAADHGITDRSGKVTMPWVDGSHADEPLTVFDLVASALHKVDVRFDTACDGVMGADHEACVTDTASRRAQWKEARSALFDTFLGTDGDGGQKAKLRNKHTVKLVVRLLETLREQTNAQCPTRETGGGCAWGRERLAKSLEDTLSGPLFAAGVDVVDTLQASEATRAGTGRLLTRMLQTGDRAEQDLLATSADMLQVLQARGQLAPIFAAIAPAASLPDDPAGPGAAVTALRVLKAALGADYDEHHVLFDIMRRSVEPMNAGEDTSPIEIILDSVAAIHRVDADAPEDPKGPLPAPLPLAPADYDAMFGTVRDFMLGDKRGLEQFYYIVQNRQRTPTVE